MKVISLLIILLIIGRVNSAQTVTDIDGNVYSTDTIGTQVWMTENLKTAKYNNGNVILNISDNTLWQNSSSGAYAWHSNDSVSYNSLYGKLYNWYAINSGMLCPVNWHVSNDNDWEILTNYLGGVGEALNKLKETGTVHWADPNEGTNQSGFSALPSGSRDYTGNYGGQGGASGYWWTSSEQDNNSAWCYYISGYYQYVRRVAFDKKSGFSVRCVKDVVITNLDTKHTSTIFFYPNPANGTISLKISGNSDSYLLVTDLQGKVLLNQLIISESVDVSKLNKGIYIIKLMEQSKTLSGLLFKE